MQHPIRPEHQQRYRQDQQFEAGGNFDFYVHRKIGWLYYRATGKSTRSFFTFNFTIAKLHNGKRVGAHGSPHHLGNGCDFGFLDGILYQAWSEIMMQEQKVESLKSCFSEFQHQAYAWRLELEDTHDGHVESWKDQVRLPDPSRYSDQKCTRNGRCEESSRTTSWRILRTQNGGKIMRQYESSLLSVQEMQEQMNSMNDWGEFQEVESNHSGWLSHVSSQPAMIPSSPIWTTGQVFGNNFSAFDSPRDHPQWVQSDDVQRNWEVVPEAGRTKTIHTSGDGLNHGTIPMPTFTTRPSSCAPCRMLWLTSHAAFTLRLHLLGLLWHLDWRSFFTTAKIHYLLNSVAVLLNHLFPQGMRPTRLSTTRLSVMTMRRRISLTEIEDRVNFFPQPAVSIFNPRLSGRHRDAEGSGFRWRTTSVLTRERSMCSTIRSFISLNEKAWCAVHLKTRSLSVQGNLSQLIQDALWQQLGHRWNWRSQNTVWQLVHNWTTKSRKNSVLGIASAWRNRARNQWQRDNQDPDRLPHSAHRCAAKKGRHAFGTHMVYRETFFANPHASSSAPYPQELNPWETTIEEPIHMSTAEKSGRPEQKSRSEMPVWTVNQRCSHLQWRRLFKELWGRPTTTADFRSPLWQVPYTSNLCLLEDKVQDRGMYLFAISYWSDAMDERNGDGWFSGWFTFFVTYERNSNADFWRTRCEDCFSAEQNHP